MATNITAPIFTTPSMNISLISSTLNQTLNGYYYELAGDINFYGLSIIIPLGLLGNVFSIYVFLASPILRHTTSGQWLVALEVADSTVLVCEMFRWFTLERHYVAEYSYIPAHLGLNFYDTSDAACKIITSLKYASILWSVWITVAIATERLIAVAWPLKISLISTSTRTRVSIAVIYILGLGLGLYPVWTLCSRISTITDGKPKCRICNESAYNTWNDIVNKCLSVLIPGVLITLLTIAIICLLYRARNKRKTHLAISTSAANRKGGRKLGLSVESQLTIILLAVCISTTALRAPYTVAYYVRRTTIWEAPGNSSSVKDTNAISYFTSQVTSLINVINYAFNFVLYCLCGSSFRKTIRNMFCRDSKEQGKNSQNSARATTTLEEISMHETRIKESSS